MKLINKLMIWGAVFIATSQASIEKGYELLLDNQVEKARTVFLEESQSFLDKNKAKGFIGLSQIESWYGNSDLQADYCIQAIQLSLSPETLEPCNQVLYLMARSVRSKYREPLLKIAQEAYQKWPGEAFATNLQAEVQNYHLVNSDLEKVKSWNQDVGLIKEWKMAGPFNNYSNSAFFNPLPVEKGFNYSEVYDGENGLEVPWRDFKHISLEVWTFLNYYQNVKNSVNYFATSVHSNKKQKAILSFGVSGSYSVWLNGELQLNSSQFRNSGMDEFQVEVNLKKGANALLLKLGHTDSKMSNFTLRFLDKQKQPLTLKQSYEPQPEVKTLAQTPQQLINEWESDLNQEIRQKKYSSFVFLLNRLILKEDFEKGLQVALQLQKLKPQSSWLNLLISEIYTRRGDGTLAQLYLDKAYRLDPNSGRAWRFQLGRILEESNPQKSLEYFQNRPAQIKMSADLHLELTRIYYQLNAENPLLNLMEDMEKLYPDNDQVMNMLYTIRLQMNNPQRAKVILDKMKTHFGYHPQTASIFFEALIREGKMLEASQYLSKSLEGQPSATGYLQSLSELYFEMNLIEPSLEYANKILEINPWVTSAYEMKMKIFEKLGQTQKLDETYQEFITLNFYDYKMMDRYQELKKLKPWASKVKEYSLNELKELSKQWKDRPDDNSLVLLSQVSNLVYPSGGYESYERLVVEVFDQKGVDQWKETNLSYKGNYENVTIQRAVVIKKDGQTLAADSKGLKMVFKNLEPGDYIDIKWRRRNYYPGKLAKNFDSQYFFASLRPTVKYYFEVISPQGKKYNVKQHLNKLKPQRFEKDGFEYQVWERNQVDAYERENRLVTVDVAWPWIQVSSFPSWNLISDWYAGLTNSKAQVTPELESLADSLFAQAKTSEEKVNQVHAFITEKIRYSSVSFRQAGYVPQTAVKSLSTRVGDCKDMAVLAKTLLKLVNVDSDLVLVETRNESSAEMLPSLDFNHCILKTPHGYVDFTAPNHPWNVLPKSDQGARALVINKKLGSQLVWLPKFKGDVEYTHRVSKDSLLSNGTFIRSIKNIRSGNHAAGFRSNVKHRSEDELRTNLQKVLRASYSHAELGDYQIKGMGSNDSLMDYTYDFKAAQSAYLNTKTMAFPMPWPDAIGSDNLVREKERKFPLEDWDVGGFFGSRVHEMTLVLPQGYQLLDLPKQISLKNQFGAYTFEYTQKGKTLHAKRSFMLEPNNVEPEDFKAYMEFMNQVVAADNGVIILIKE